ncbi:MAG TPA: phosphoribosylamine--glycine ligase [Vicinamibacteria bacterium]|nr:phosphoribosylamine--glycine ligase [Vicinamibacteria bacterium]
MRVLVVGGGGREHALVWKLRQSPEVTEIFCAPGNAGIRSLADPVPIDPSDIVELADFAEKLSIGLTVVGPELPLILGLADEFRRRGLAVFGPNRAASELEGSKAFAKDFLKRHKIPTARFHVVSSMEEAKSVIESDEVGLPLVVKADGLAGGKGVSIVESREEALDLAKKLIAERQLGSAGTRLVFEEFLQGEEVSFFALSDGANVLPLVAAQDHKRALDNDEGPNTGGMGSICPATILNADTLKHIVKDVVHPTISGLAAEGRKYQGILYSGLMLTADGPKVLEFNVRLGDPEAQAILPRLKSDLFPLLMEVSQGRLGQHRLEWVIEPAVTVVLASSGYPGKYETGKVIEGLDSGKVEMDEGLYVFHSGTKMENGKIVTSGGRVCAVTGISGNLKGSIERAYEGVERIHFEGRQFRKDIGQRALTRLAGS